MRSAAMIYNCKLRAIWRRGARLGAALLAAILWMAAVTAQARSLEPFADIHIHYNWNQADAVEPAEAIKRLEANNVVLAVVSSTPPDVALELSGAAGPWIVPLFMPYLEPGRRHSWFNDPRVVPATRDALASGRFLGVGEIHLTGGLAPSPKQPHGVVDALFELAREYDVPILVHTEASSYLYFLPLCRRHPRVRIQWAHSGGILPPAQVDKLLEACPNVWPELSARDTERYYDSQIVDADGRLLPDWERLVLKYQDRFMTGSDPVWPVDARHYWDYEDTGWDRIGRYLDFHRRWISFLPEAVGAKIRLGNALRFYRVESDPRIATRGGS
jgi:predicted TIM-barrel fold metal-dependent hydrolase